MTGARADLARLAGIAEQYRDTTSELRQTAPETEIALLAAMGLPAATEAEAADTLAAWRVRADRALPDWAVVEAERRTRLPLQAPARDWHLVREDGAEDGGPCGDGVVDLPALPVGYHQLTCDGATATLLSAPARLPAPTRGWGVTLPLYGLRTEDRGGFGDYADLAEAVAGIGSAGAHFAGINPIHAGFPTDPAAYSPYAPSHRRRLNTAHIAVPGDGGTQGALIDYATDLPAKMAALELAFAADPLAERVAAFRADGGAALERFVTHQALSEALGPYWRDWPDAYRDPTGDAVARFAAENDGRLRFHAWAQLRAQDQLAGVRQAADRAGMTHGLYLDLAVGTHPFGAETWADPATFAHGVSLGAPPDAFSPQGQTWGLAPMNPLSLIAQGFEPLAATLRAQLRFARVLRVDHILGFDRAFWVSEDGATPGGYVAMPRAAMLAVARIEATRAGATIIGEDLGNVPDGLRTDLDAAGILGCRVAMFEKLQDTPPRFRDASRYDTETLAAFASHDLPTWAGWRRGRDIDWWAHLGRLDASQADAARSARKAEVEAFDAALESGNDVDAMHAFLGRSAARLVALQIEDILGLVEQPNLPGTIFDHPNWRRRLPVAADAIGADPRLHAAASAVGR